MLTQAMKIVNNELKIGNFTIRELMKKYQSPLYIYDEEEMRSQITKYLTYFKSDRYQTHIVYASKAYLSPYMCRLVDGYGLYIDVVSLGDIQVVEKSGFNLARAVFHGNNKSDEELEYAITHKVGIIVVDNLDELLRLIALAKTHHQQVDTMFRVNPGIEAHTHEYIQTSLLSSKFGESIFDEKVICEVMALYRNHPEIRLLGFHAHIGSQIVSEKPFLACAKTMVEFSARIVAMTGYPLSSLNLGGGFGIRYLETDDECRLEEVLPKIIAEVDALALEHHFPLKHLYIEPGRSIVGRAGFTVYEAGMIKRTFGGKQYLFVDGGMTDNIRPALYQAKYTVMNVARMNDEATIKVDVAGKCCESGDIIAKDIMLPPTEKGDPICVFCTGSYCNAMSSNYNGAMKLPVVFVRGDQVKVASRRENTDDLMRLF